VEVLDMMSPYIAQAVAEARRADMVAATRNRRVVRRPARGPAAARFSLASLLRWVPRHDRQVPAVACTARR
jgi:hypothetical protein